MQQKNGKYLLLLALAVVLVVVLLGRMEFHNELQREVQQKVLLGYLDEQQYSGTVTVQAEQWPAWATAFERDTATQVAFAPGTSGRIGIFAEVVYFENRYEWRTWFSGRLLKQASEYYYRPVGLLTLQPVYDEQEPDIDRAELKGPDYDYQNFRGE